MTQIQHNQLVSFIWNIANDVLVNIYNKGDYRKVILPMIVLRRFNAVLEETKDKVLEMKERLTNANIIQQDEALCAVAGQAFCNSSPFTLKALKRTNSQQLKLDFIAYLDGFSANVQEFIETEILPYTPDAIIDADEYVIGYELSFTKYFYKPKQLRTLDEIRANIRAIEESVKGLLNQILN